MAMAEIPRTIQNNNGDEGMDVDTEEVNLNLFSPPFLLLSKFHLTPNISHPSSPNCPNCPR